MRGQMHAFPSPGESAQLAVAKLELLTAATGAGIIAADMVELGCSCQVLCQLLRHRAILVRVRVGHITHLLGALLNRLAHSDQAAAADFHSTGTDQLQSLAPFFPGVGGDDLGEMRTGGFKVVVVTMDFMSQVQNYLMSQQYESLLKKANFKAS